MNNVCVREKNGLKNLGYIQNYDTYSCELQDMISEEFNYYALDNFIDEQINAKKVFYFNKDFSLVFEDSIEKKYKLVMTGYHCKETNCSVYAGFEMKKTWCGVVFGTMEELIKKWKSENSKENIYNFIFFRNIGSLNAILDKLTEKENDEQYIREVIEEAYRNALKNKTLYSHLSKSGKMILYFDSGVKSADGEKIWLISEPNNRKEALQKWFGLFFVKQSLLIKRIFDMNYFNISNMVFEDSCRANEFINSLAEKAIKENWIGYSDITGPYTLPVLKGYIENTYARLRKEAEKKNNKLVERDGFQYFNSGLLDKFYRQIFVRGKLCAESRYIDGIGKCDFNFLSDLKIYSQNEEAIAKVLKKEELPQMASYCDKYSELIFDASLEIKLCDTHIFEDGVRRGRLPIYSQRYEDCKNNVEDYNNLMAEISRVFEAEVGRMMLLSKRNYNIAIPQYVKDNDEIQFMLPIYLDDNKKIPECILSLRLSNEAAESYYIGTTILTPEMAINNARLISGPEFHWIDSIKAA